MRLVERVCVADDAAGDDDSRVQLAGSLRRGRKWTPGLVTYRDPSKFVSKFPEGGPFGTPFQRPQSLSFSLNPLVCGEPRGGPTITNVGVRQAFAHL